MRLHGYALSPIDDFWGWLTLDRIDPDFVNSASRLFEDAKRFATYALGWEGDISAGPYFSALPDPECCGSLFMVAFKQSNNGETFVVSPFPLSYLLSSGIQCMTHAEWST